MAPNTGEDADVPLSLVTSPSGHKRERVKVSKGERGEMFVRVCVWERRGERE